LINNFSKKLGVDKMKIRNWLLKNKIDPKKRAQELSFKEWEKLVEDFTFLN
jgi:16S rRNA A1518/A1519 N6-dimethyltransferase RsmA/KsgA/DIM1 with predicted DNA glycosylase/AP lyase activity